ncbi:unnamed protein product [Sympodiomycopsis kandeliae]
MPSALRYQHQLEVPPDADCDPISAAGALRVIHCESAMSRMIRSEEASKLGKLIFGKLILGKLILEKPFYKKANTKSCTQPRGNKGVESGNRTD